MERETKEDELGDRSEQRKNTPRSLTPHSSLPHSSLAYFSEKALHASKSVNPVAALTFLRAQAANVPRVVHLAYFPKKETGGGGGGLSTCC